VWVGVGVVDAEAVAAKAIAAIQSLSGSGGDAGAGAPHKLLNTPVVLAEHLEEMVDVMAMTDPSGKRKDLTNEVIVEKGGEASAGSKEQKKAAAFRAQLADDAASEAAAMQAELEAARVRAARIRMNTGATPMGTLEMGPFNLPNPGGGADLIEGASLVLVPGHRWVHPSSTHFLPPLS
jgi:ATP-binding cassette subfamily F protein 3